MILVKIVNTAACIIQTENSNKNIGNKINKGIKNKRKW